MSDYLFSLAISYFIGSIPTAYLVVKLTSNVDIRTVGSGNVGGRNALEVTGKKAVGIFVVAVDLLKGVISVLIARYFFDNAAAAVSAAMIGSVFGHCYPVWLKFKGGRGLATAAGVLLIVNWIWPILWLALYFFSSTIVKNVHKASVIALVATPLVGWIIPDSLLAKLIPDFFTSNDFFTASLLLVAICLSRHVQPLKESYEEKTA